MPWEIQESEGEFCVHKQDTGEKLKCYPTKEEAADYMAALYANEPEAAKLGARHSDTDRKIIKDIHDKAHDIMEHSKSLGHEIEEIGWTPKPAKSEGELQGGPSFSGLICAVKAAGDWELDVLVIPYGGPNKGKDTDGEYFSQRTELFAEKFTNPLVTYYHGLSPEGKPDGNYEVIGEVQGKPQPKADGIWWRILLDQSSKFAKRIWEAARKGMAAASSGSIAHLVRTAKDGEILRWPLGEIALIDTEGKRKPANHFAVALPVMAKQYKDAGRSLPVLPEAEAVLETGGEPVVPEPEATFKSKKEINDMDEKDVAKIVADALIEDRKAQAAALAAEKAEQEKIEVAVKAAKAEWEEEAKKSNRLPSDKRAPVVAKFGELWAYDNLEPADAAFAVGLLEEARGTRVGDGICSGASDALKKAAAVKMFEDKSDMGAQARGALKAAGFAGKTDDEVMHSDLTSYGAEWVGVAYSTALWEAIRLNTFLLGKLPNQIEVPQGQPAVYLPLESADPVWYTVTENSQIDDTSGNPVATVTSSQFTTGRVQLTLKKLGCRVLWSGELEEDSLIPFVSQLRKQMTVSGAEYLEHALIDGDTETGSGANINNNSGVITTGAAYLVFNGFRKSPLVTTPANSRAAGALSVEDYLATVKLMGVAGINAMDTSKVFFLQDVNTNWKSLELPEVKTRDVYSQPTVEGGKLNSIWGYPVYTSPQMHRAATASRKCDSAGFVDATTITNNLYGAILAVRPDQWTFGWRRRMTLETTRIANADTTEITAWMRCGLIQRDTEASAISYGVIV